MKNTTAVVGSLFNNLVLKRRDGKVIPVPVSYGPRSKWIEAHKGLDQELAQFENFLPRISYEMVSMNYDTNRKITNKQSQIRSPDTSDKPRQQVNAPVPYNVDFTVYLQTKNLNDGWEILEQVLPFFTPSYTVRVRNFPAEKDSPVEPQNAYDMPIVLTSVAFTDDWTGDPEERRTVEWTLELSCKVFLYGPIRKTSVILDSRATAAVPPDGIGVNEITRGDDMVGEEIGFVRIPPDSDSASFANDSDFSPPIENLFDSEGNVVRVIRQIDIV